MMKARLSRRKAVAFRQIGFQDLGVLHAPLREAGYEICYLDAFDADPREIDPVEPDLIVVLGGPFGVDEARPFVDAQVDVLRVRLRAGRPTFGICLGSQIVAAALDAAVRPGRKEIGWKPVALTAPGRDGPLAALADLPVLHWHGDTFDLPEGAVRLASTDLCGNQAFAIGSKIAAVQFHLEVDPRAGMADWIRCHDDELRREGIDADALVRGARAASSTDRSRVPAMFALWLAGIA